MALAIATSWISYYNSDKIVLSLNGARPATKEEKERAKQAYDFFSSIATCKL